MEGLAHDKKRRGKEREGGDGNETERENSPALAVGGARGEEGRRGVQEVESGALRPRWSWRKAGRQSGTPCGVSVSDSSALP